MVKSNNNKQYLGRGLHSAKWEKALSEGGELYGLLELVKSDEDLVIEIRNDYFNVYYKGGNMAKIASADSIQFDHNYYRGRKVEKEEDRKELKRRLLAKLKNERNYNDFVKEMKSLMNDYWTWLKEEKGASLHEKDVQHSLCINNTEDSEYTIIDVEFQISTLSEYTYVKPICPIGRTVARKKKAPRFDIIAVRNSDHQLCVIELKSGINSLNGKSGIGDHADSYEGSIGRKPQVFKEEILGVIENKKAYGLLKRDFMVSENAPEFMYAYSFYENDNESKDEQKKIFLEERKKMQCEQYRVMFLEEGDYKLTDN